LQIIFPNLNFGEEKKKEFMNMYKLWYV
jgi:hypothetical protein